MISFRRRNLLAFIAAILVMSGEAVWGAGVVEGFVRFTPASSSSPLAGSSTDTQFPGSAGWDPITGLSQSFTNLLNIGSQSTSGEERFNPISFYKPMDVLSPKLFLGCATGRRYTVELALRQPGMAGNDQAPVYHATLTTAGIKSLHYAFQTNDDGNWPEQVEIQYGQIAWDAITFNAEGIPTFTVSVNWSVITNGGTGVTTVTNQDALQANPDQVARVFGETNTFSEAQLLANDTVGAIFDGLPTNTTALGGHVSVVSSNADILYVPPALDTGADDSFVYRIRDAYGLTAIGNVTVGIVLPNGKPIGNLSITISSQGTDLRLAGLPGHAYQLQAAATLNGVWTNVGGPVSGTVSNGVAAWLQLPSTNSFFYRAYCNQ